jgi:hypothetical protein
MSLGARSGEHGGRTVTGLAAQRALCGSVQKPRVAPLPLHNWHSNSLSVQAVRTHGAANRRCRFQRIPGTF